MYCNKCGAPLEPDAKFCTACGATHTESVSDQQQYTKPETAYGHNTTNNYYRQPNIKSLACPRCGSTNLQAISEVTGQGAKCWKLCLCGILGLCGTGKTTTTHFWACGNCGNKFKM